MTDRCPVRFGGFQCDRAPGHDGEHEARDEAKPWLGPAISVLHCRSGNCPHAATRPRQDAPAGIEATSAPSGPLEAA